MDNIDLSGSDWVAIGDYFNPFTGTFDGNGYTIFNLNINSLEDNQGLFGYANGIIKDVHLEGGTVKGVSYVGSLVGCSEGVIENCSSTVDVYRHELGLMSSSLGGLVGYSSGEIINSYATGDVSGERYVGGLVGHSSGEITNSYATGDVSAMQTAGGLVGYSSGGITNSLSTGAVEKMPIPTGELYGESSGTVSGCYAVKTSSGNVVGGPRPPISPAYTEQIGVTLKSAEYFDDPANWESVLGNAYDYSTVPPKLKSPEPVPIPNPSGGGEAIRLHVGANFSEEDAISINTTFEMDGFAVDFSSTESAAQSVEQIDTLLNIITTKRTEMGAVSNRLDSIMNAQRTKIENYSSAKSTITDTDMAKESSILISKQILQQAGSALLLQTSESQRTIISQLINGL